MQLDFVKHTLLKLIFNFFDLIGIVKSNSARSALLRCNEIAKEVGLSSMTMKEINEEIYFVRKSKKS
jgi:hypothetical protein